VVTLAQLWLPILLGGVAVFFASFVLRMVLPHHWNDFARVPDEDAAMEALRKAGVVGPGQYMFPHATTPKAMQDPVWVAKWQKGPTAQMFVFPSGELNMGKSLLHSFLFNLFGTFMAAYLATMALPAGTSGATVMRFFTTIGFLVYGGALIWGPIWKGSTWTMLAKELFDALVYGLATGAVFVLLWPAS
jgi:hypothetical protein